MIARALPFALVAGCSGLLGLGDPTIIAGTTPSCDSGWTLRASVAIHNASAQALTDYQIQLVFDSASEIDAGRLRPDGADLRFTTTDDPAPLDYVIERGLGGRETLVWIRAPSVPVGDTTILFYEGNPAANPAPTASPFVEDIIVNPSFETAGSWYQASVLNGGIFLGDRTWATDGVRSLFMDVEVRDQRSIDASAALIQDVTFPQGSEYVLRFDMEVLAASNKGIGGANNGQFVITFASGVDDLWRLSGDSGNITGLRLGEETTPFAAGSVPLSLLATVNGGNDNGYAKGNFDNLRLRRHIDPEPTATLQPATTLCDR